MKPFSMMSLIFALILVVAGCATSTVASAPPPALPAARDDSLAEPSTLDQYHRAAAIAAERAGDTERAAAHRSYLPR